MSKLDRDESVAIQYSVRSAKGSWHKMVKKVSTRIHKKGSVRDGLRALK
ncbi:MAG: hypothetical protein NTX66_01800 [Candidatus Falkowbacteria bacterium]|nr:hypothetical protein [Candidatus Falkowbacteria bacterium]